MDDSSEGGHIMTLQQIIDDPSASTLLFTTMAEQDYQAGMEC
jgi:hypothetical protein